MQRRSGAGGGPDQSRSLTATTRKRRSAPKAARASSPGPKTEIEQLVRELAEAKERQAATAEVLSLISDAPTDLFPVFDRIVKNAARLCQSVLSAVYRRDGDYVDLVAHDQFSPESVAAVRKAYPAPLTSNNLISVALRERRVVHEPDVLVHDPARPGQHGTGIAHRPQYRERSFGWPDQTGNQTRRGHENPDHRAA